MSRTHGDKTLHDFISIKVRSDTFRKYMDINSTSEVNRNAKANTFLKFQKKDILVHENGLTKYKIMHDRY